MAFLAQWKTPRGQGFGKKNRSLLDLVRRLRQ